MARLKSLDEMPECTGLEIEWDSILPGTYSGRSKARKVRQTRVAKIVSAALALAVVSVGTWLVGAELTPTKVQIEVKAERRARTEFAIRQRTTTSDPTPAEGPDGRAAATTSIPSTAMAFPAGRIDSVQPETKDQRPIVVDDGTGDGMPKVIRFRGMIDGRLWRTLHLEAGGSMETKLPPGGYAMTIAEGATWRGDEEMFGDEGRYHAPQNVDVRDGLRTHLRLPPASAGRESPTTSRRNF